MKASFIYNIMDKFTTEKCTKEKSINNDFVRLEKNIVLRESAIRWMKQMEECLYIFSKSDGCHINESYLHIEFVNQQTPQVIIDCYSILKTNNKIE